MAPICITDVVKFSSEDLKYPASNIVQAKKWMNSKQDLSGKAFLKFTIEFPSLIHYIDLGYSNVAEIEIHASSSCKNPDKEFSVLLPKTILQTLQQSRNGVNKSGCKMFNFDEHFCKNVAKQKWNTFKILIWQPHGRNKQMGIDFIRIGSLKSHCDTKLPEKKIQPLNEDKNVLESWKNSPLGKLLTSNQVSSSPCLKFESKLQGISSKSTSDESCLSRTAQMIMTSKLATLKANENKISPQTSNMKKKLFKDTILEKEKSAMSKDFSRSHSSLLSDPNNCSKMQNKTSSYKSFEPKKLTSLSDGVKILNEKKPDLLSHPFLDSCSTSKKTVLLNNKTVIEKAIKVINVVEQKNLNKHKPTLNVTLNHSTSEGQPPAEWITNRLNLSPNQAKLFSPCNKKLTSNNCTVNNTNTDSFKDLKEPSPDLLIIDHIEDVIEFSDQSKVSSSWKKEILSKKSSSQRKDQDLVEDVVMLESDVQIIDHEEDVEEVYTHEQIKRLRRAIKKFFNQIDLETFDPRSHSLKDLRKKFEKKEEVKLNRDGRSYFKEIAMRFMAIFNQSHQCKKQLEVNLNLPQVNKRKSCNSSSCTSSAKVQKPTVTNKNSTSSRLVQCPICNDFFDESVIEGHADLCLQEETCSIVQPIRSSTNTDSAVDSSPHSSLSSQEQERWIQFSKEPKPYHERLNTSAFDGCMLVRCPSCGQKYKSTEIEVHCDECVDKVNSGCTRMGLYLVDNKKGKKRNKKNFKEPGNPVVID